MENPESFYNNQLEVYRKESKRSFKKLSVLSLLRLSVFLATAIGIYFTFPNWQITIAIAIFGIAIFLFLLSQYTDLKHKRALYKRLIALNKEEIKIASGEFHHRPDGLELQDPKHYYSLDIDLFGRGSFFQFINRTAIKEGREKLANFLLANDILNIKSRQEAIQELAQKPKWRQHYTGVAQGVKVENSTKSILTWLKDYQPFLSSTHYVSTIIYSLASIVILILGVLEILSLTVIVYWLLLGLAITAIYFKRINAVAQRTDKAKETFRQYALLLECIEDESFKAYLLKEKQQKIAFNGVKASEIFTKFSKALDALDNRNNLISAIFGNGFLLWDIRQTYYVEQWITKYRHIVNDWFEVVTFFDSYNSLGNYVFNHQSFTFPKITDDSTTISAENLGHPLLNPLKRVNSNFDLEQEQFFIITGANMAGKSTFLRTVALHIVMANVGLPVCARHSVYKPIKLITSMRTTDSLADESSYFFSELTRLKFIVDNLTKDNTYFVILDEILKGTNSTDKAIGSRKFVEKLVRLNATGIIATHDLSLTEIEGELEAIKNYYFDAEIIKDELHFDYKLKPGVCKNMNASFLLSKMDIV